MYRVPPCQHAQASPLSITEISITCLREGLGGTDTAANTTTASTTAADDVALVTLIINFAALVPHFTVPSHVQRCCKSDIKKVWMWM